jgi:hypothetical protein
VAPSMGPTAAGRVPQHSHTRRRRGGPIGTSGRACRRDDPTIPSPCRRQGPPVDLAEGSPAASGSRTTTSVLGKAPEGPAPSWH